MCGIAGLFDSNFSQLRGERVLQKLKDILHHRGPDDCDIWADVNAGIGFAHTRLAIHDLSFSGHQPMVSHSQRYVVVFNGEIYNYLILKTELDVQGHFNWKSDSDTEVLLAAIDFWGLEKAVKRFNGMFAFALWDRKEKTLFLVRDRLGIKPLYYGWLDKTFFFTSELKAIKAFPARNNISRKALALYLRYKCIPAPYSIYENIYKLLPGSILKLDLNHLAQKKAPKINKYWSCQQVALSGQENLFIGSETEALALLHKKLAHSVKLRMSADVPLGAFLSGGIDSSLIVALMQSQTTQAVKTYSIGFYEDKYNEAHNAKLIANHLKTEHTELYLSSADTQSIIPKLAHIYDEPFADASQLPTYLVSKLAKQEVTVVLSGDGGDEIFCGYNRYFLANSLWKKIRFFPLPLRFLLSRLIRLLPPTYYGRLFQLFSSMLRSQPQIENAGVKLLKLASAFEARKSKELYENFLTCNINNRAVNRFCLSESDYVTQYEEIELSPIFNEMMLIDMAYYLPNDILTKLDRASMAVGLEARVPLLDHQVVEFAWQLPISMKVKGTQGKWLTRQLLKEFLPLDLFNRPKQGFSVPIADWLRGPLRVWAEDLLSESNLDKSALLCKKIVRKRWEEHLSGYCNWEYFIWSVLMFQMWLEENG